MAVAIQPNGEFIVTYVGPYVGLHTMMPETLIPDSASPALSDFILRNAELRSRPQFLATQFTSPVPANRITAVGSLNGVLWAIPVNGLYTLNFGSGIWTLAAGSGSASVENWRIFNGTIVGSGSKSVLYISTAQGNHLSTWDGSTFTQDTATLAAGPTNLGGVFVDELDNHLVMAVLGEGGIAYNARVRWSATSLPGVWDTTANVNAGFNDFLDVPDAITGLMMLGRVGYIFRTDGITEMAPTGRGAQPFEFNHLWGSQLGIGNVRAYGLAQYGTTGVFISRDNIYSVMSYNIQPIGGGARDAIMADLATMTQGAGVLSNSFGVIAPYLSTGVVPDSGVQPSGGGAIANYTYLCYYLFINQGNNCKVYVYSFDESNWTVFNLNGINVTGKPSIATGDTTGDLFLMIPNKAMPSGNSSIGILDITTFNDANQGSSYNWRQEDIAPSMVCTVRRVTLTYRDLGTFTATVNVTGLNDNGTLVTNTQQLTVTGVNDQRLKTVFFFPTDANGRCVPVFRPQLNITRAAGGGPISIVMAQMFGKVDKENL